MSTFYPRRTHRKRSSALRISTDTIATLPEYNLAHWPRPEDPPSDLPPDYPDSAEEADEDTDSEASTAVPHLPPSLNVSPRRIRRFLVPAYRRRQSTEGTTDQFLDSLLERSLHALEMSNALLQSSISTQTSLSAVLASDPVAERSLETQAVNLSSRIRGNGGVHEHWADDLDEISRGVEGLFGEEGSRRSSLRRRTSDLAISSSLPTDTFPAEARRQHRKRPSLDLRKVSNTSPHEPQLRFTPQSRNDLVSPPPRALTQYGSTADSDDIVLPSTLGLRASSSWADWRPLDMSPSNSNLSNGSLHASPPAVTDHPVEHATPAYNKLASFVTQPASPSSSRTNSPRQPFGNRKRRGSSSTSTSTERGVTYSPSRACRSPDRCNHKQSGSNTSRSRSVTPKRPASPPPPPSLTHRCPPILEIPQSSSSSSSDESCRAKLTVRSLRKILDEQPSSVSLIAPSITAPTKLSRPPAFLPRTPAPGPSSSTSTATASISRLYTKSTHSSSTRPPSPPRHSSMKQHSISTTPSPSSTTLSIPDMVIGGVARALGSSSAPGSGRTTPKRISFAELPESYASSRSSGSLKFQGKRKRSGNKDKEDKEGGGWWMGWLTGASGMPPGGSGVGMGTSRSDIFEERIARGWGGRVGFGSGVDEWGI